MALFDFSPGATDITAIANLLTAVINRRDKLEAAAGAGDDYAKRQIANLEEIEAVPMFLLRKWHKLIGVTPEGDKPA